MLKMSPLRKVALLILLLAPVCRADSIDDAEAQRRGVPVQQVQLENAKQRIADLEKQVALLQSRLRAYEQPAPTPPPAPVAAAAPIPVTPRAVPLTAPGEISSITGRPKTVPVSGYTRKDGTYVAPYYRSPPSR